MAHMILPINRSPSFEEGYHYLLFPSVGSIPQRLSVAHERFVSHTSLLRSSCSPPRDPPHQHSSPFVFSHIHGSIYDLWYHSSTPNLEDIELLGGEKDVCESCLETNESFESWETYLKIFRWLWWLLRCGGGHCRPVLYGTLLSNSPSYPLLLDCSPLDLSSSPISSTNSLSLFLHSAL